MIKIAVDMDGVLADFDSALKAHFGFSEPEKNGFTHDEFWAEVSRMDRPYRHLPLMPDARKLWEGLKATGCSMYVLTAIPRADTVATAEEDKRAWIHEHFGSDVEFRIGPYSRNKWKHANPGDVLIDDRVTNIEDWIERGKGVGILYTGSAQEALDAVNHYIRNAPFVPRKAIRSRPR